jgi:AcrR family transcriptional regulator
MATLPPERSEPPSPPISRRARRTQEAPRRVGDVNEAALLEAARDLVLGGEFQQTPIRQIAERAGISRQTFYFYYQSKDDLLAQLVSETLYASQLWRATLYEHDWKDPAEAVRRQIEASVSVWRDNRELLGAANDMAPRAPAVRAQWIAIAEDSADFIADLVVSSTKIEALRDRDAARHMIVTIIWMIERNCYMHFVHGSDNDDEALIQRLSEIYVRAVGFD